jgi:hypothetical protein
MRLKDYRDDLRARLKDPECDAAYFLQISATGDKTALSIALKEIVEAGDGLIYPPVELTKLRASPHAAEQPGNWDGYHPGDITNNAPLPVDYTLTGILLVPPRIGFRVKVLRVTRNGVHVRGVFASTEVVEPGHDGFIIRNSVYRLKRLKPIFAGTPGETSTKRNTPSAP